MNKLNLPPFYVGQKVIAVRSHSQGVFNKGDVFTVTGVIRKCCGWNVSIGIPSTKPSWHCGICDRSHHSETEWFFSQRMFTTAQEKNFPLMTFTQIKETEKEEILILN